jgi:hypothetical protein
VCIANGAGHLQGIRDDLGVTLFGIFLTPVFFYVKGKGVG